MDANRFQALNDASGAAPARDLSEDTARKFRAYNAHKSLANCLMREWPL
jgi:hypothetical protein